MLKTGCFVNGLVCQCYDTLMYSFDYLSMHECHSCRFKKWNTVLNIIPIQTSESPVEG